ncbi:DoxX family protein [Actinoplanes sp. TRM 88003]|uniref:DoxX family protein n=1 Tax=Paractinoplanes aksuensis TaxID=2939490 RepID=A0ABT1DTQ5_9ACTN|nr:DoxX family protein [Actinoplanes aksuensis]MCO8274207.1 DoxX family protein [Actinoplanes aksuensis]
MNLTLWILAGALALAFTAGGASLLLLPRQRYRALRPSQHWVDDFGDAHLKAIGTIKIIGCLGLILPAASGVAPVLTPLAACGLALFMAGAATTRFRRREWKLLPGDLFYLSLFAFLAWGRFDLYPIH